MLSRTSKIYSLTQGHSDRFAASIYTDNQGQGRKELDDLLLVIVEWADALNQ